MLARMSPAQDGFESYVTVPRVFKQQVRHGDVGCITESVFVTGRVAAVFQVAASGLLWRCFRLPCRCVARTDSEHPKKRVHTCVPFFFTVCRSRTYCCFISDSDMCGYRVACRTACTAKQGTEVALQHVRLGRLPAAERAASAAAK